MMMVPFSNSDQDDESEQEAESEESEEEDKQDDGAEEESEEEEKATDEVEEAEDSESEGEGDEEEEEEDAQPVQPAKRDNATPKKRKRGSQPPTPASSHRAASVAPSVGKASSRGNKEQIAGVVTRTDDEKKLDKMYHTIQTADAIFTESADMWDTQEDLSDFVKLRFHVDKVVIQKFHWV